MIKARLGYSRRPDGEVSTEGWNVANRMDGNAKFLHPPVKIADLIAALEDFDAARAQLFDCGKKVFVRRDKCRDIVVKLSVQLGHYVEAAAEDDIVVFLSSGSNRRGKPVPSKECDAPSIYKIVQGKSGVLSVYFTPFYRQVNYYEFRWAASSQQFFSRRMEGNPPSAIRQTARYRRKPNARYDLLLPGARVPYQRNLYQMERHRLQICI